MKPHHVGQQIIQLSMLYNIGMCFSEKFLIFSKMSYGPIAKTNILHNEYAITQYTINLNKIIYYYYIFSTSSFVEVISLFSTVSSSVFSVTGFSSFLVLRLFFFFFLYLNVNDSNVL